jgi:DnaJ-class molecular chaperone
MIPTEGPCWNCDDGEEAGDGLMTVRLCRVCRGVQRVRECVDCAASGTVFVKSWFGLYRRVACKSCGGRGHRPAFDRTQES